MELITENLKEIVRSKLQSNTNEVLDMLTSMMCTQKDDMLLTEETLIKALEYDGEFLLLQLHYNDFLQELQEEKIKYKLAQSLSIIISYEDDGHTFKEIENFAKYIYTLIDPKQNLTFGVKKVQKLSQYPITILFSGILPINQLRLYLGKEIYALIHSDDAYFQPRFQQLRDDISHEIGVPILPLFPELNEELAEYQVEFIDPIEKRIIASFHIPQTNKKETLEIYLLKLFYIYKQIMKNT